MSPLGLHSVIRVTCLGLLCGLALCGCGGDGGPSPASLNEAKRFDAYRVYYAGDDVAEHPLESVEGVEGGFLQGSGRRDGRSIGWDFYYGDCDPPGGLFAEGGCEPPLQIHNYSTCRRWAGLLHRKNHLFDFRGATATGSGNGIDNPVEIFTGRTTVVIFATHGSVARSAARQLRDIRQAHPASLLPPPLPGSVQGKLPCQRKPG